MDDEILFMLDGDPAKAPTRQEINSMFRRVVHSNFKPMKEALAELDAAMRAHCVECAAFRNQIKGARLVMALMGGAIVTLIPFLWQILKALEVLLGKA